MTSQRSRAQPTPPEVGGRVIHQSGHFGQLGESFLCVNGWAGHTMH